MTDNESNGRKFQLMASNALVQEVLRFAFWIVLFLWVLTSVNFRISTNEQKAKAAEESTKKNWRHIKRIDKQLDLKPFPEEVESD